MSPNSRRNTLISSHPPLNRTSPVVNGIRAAMTALSTCPMMAVLLRRIRVARAGGSVRMLLWRTAMTSKACSTCSPRATSSLRISTLLAMSSGSVATISVLAAAGSTIAVSRRFPRRRISGALRARLGSPKRTGSCWTLRTVDADRPSAALNAEPCKTRARSRCVLAVAAIRSNVPGRGFARLQNSFVCIPAIQCSGNSCAISKTYREDAVTRFGPK